MISLDSELGQKIAEHFKALDDRKTNGSPAIIGEKQEYDNYEPIYENVVNTTGSQPKIIGYREKTDAEKQGSVDFKDVNVDPKFAKDIFTLPLVNPDELPEPEILPLVTGEIDLKDIYNK